MEVIKQIALEPSINLGATTLVDTDAVWSSTVTYAVGARVTYNYRVYQSLAAGNLNNIPPVAAVYQDDPAATASWVFVGPSNKAAMFDFKGNTLSSATTSFSSKWTIQDSQTESVAFLNINAVTVQLTVKSTSFTGSVIYDQTKGLSDAFIGDWYDYFFLPAASTITQVIFDGIPPLASGSSNYFEVIVTGVTGSTVSIGSAVGGPKYFLGLTQYGINTGIISYSKKTVDDYGNVKITKRAFAKRMEGDVEIPNSDVSRVQALMYSLRDLPCVWSGQQDDRRLQELLIVYGYYKDFSTKIAYPNHSLMSLQIEGLT